MKSLPTFRGNKFPESSLQQNQKQVHSAEPHREKSHCEENRKEDIPDCSTCKLDYSRPDDPQHRRFKNVEKVIDGWQTAVPHIKPTQENHHNRARKYECQSGNDAAPQLSLQIPHVNRELQSLRPGQHVTKSHDLHKTFFTKPPALLHHMAVHHCDLSNRSTDVDEAQH